MPNSLTEALMTARRKALLSGRPLSQTETTGIAEGYASQASENAARAKQLELQKEELAQSKKAMNAEIKAGQQQTRVSATAAGASIGGSMAAGTAMGGPVGAVIGGIVGLVAGNNCIIITACTSPNSYEVNIAREYRDKCLDKRTLDGYYRLARFVVPVLKKSAMAKKITKKILIDRIVDYGEYFMGKKPDTKYVTSTFVTNVFLSVCEILGRSENGNQ